MKRLHAALTLRHPEETSPAVGPLTVQSTCGFCAHLRTSLAAYLSRCTDTYSTDFSLCEALPSQARYTVGAHTNICSGICRPGTQMHVHEKRLLYPGNKDRSCRSRNFCIDASPHERLCSKPHGKCKIPWYKTRYLRLLSYLFQHVHVCMSSLR